MEWSVQQQVVRTYVTVSDSKKKLFQRLQSVETNDRVFLFFKLCKGWATIRAGAFDGLAHSRK